MRSADYGVRELAPAFRPLNLSKDRSKTPFVLSLSKDQPQDPLRPEPVEGPSKTPSVLSLSKDQPQDPARPEPVEGP